MYKRAKGNACKAAGNTNENAGKIEFICDTHFFRDKHTNVKMVRFCVLKSLCHIS